MSRIKEGRVAEPWLPARRTGGEKPEQETMGRERDACSTCRKTSLLLPDAGTGGRLGPVAQKERGSGSPSIGRGGYRQRGHGNLTFGGSIPRK